VVHVDAALLLTAVPTTARYTAHIELALPAAHVTVDGAGVADARTRISSLAFRMHAAKSGTGDAVLSSIHGLIAYVKGPTTGAPAAKPWARFRGRAAVPFFDPTVALRLRTQTVPAAEARLLFPGLDHPIVHARVWRDAHGRVVRLRARAGTVTIDERLSSFGVAPTGRIPRPSEIYMSVP
jgi:hypothetical protein